MPAITEAVSSQRLLAAEDAQAVRTATFTTSPFFQVSWQQRLSPLASIPAIRRITDADNVTVFAKLYLFSSYYLPPGICKRIPRRPVRGHIVEHLHAPHPSESSTDVQPGVAACDSCE